MKIWILNILFLALNLCFVNLKEISNKNKDINYNKKQISLHIQLCMSWSYTKYYEDLKFLVEKHFANVQMTMEEYPLSPTRKLCSYLIISIQIIIFTSIILGDIIKPYLSESLKKIYEVMEQNKTVTFIYVFMGGMFIQNILKNTGAFEVFLNGEKIWSKLESGEVIDPKLLMKYLNKA